MPGYVIGMVIVDDGHPSLDAMVSIPNVKHLPTKHLKDWVAG